MKIYQIDYYIAMNSFKKKAKGKALDEFCCKILDIPMKLTISPTYKDDEVSIESGSVVDVVGVEDVLNVSTTLENV